MSLVGDRLGQPGHELEAAETSSEDDDVLWHVRKVTEAVALPAGRMATLPAGNLAGRAAGRA